MLYLQAPSLLVKSKRLE